MNKKVDLRVLRTKKSIATAFMKLLGTKKFEQITIQDIADEAMINRNTFYLHYLDKEDLFEKLSSICLDDLEKSLNSSLKKIEELNQESLYTIIHEVIGSVNRHIDFYQVVMINNEILCFSKRFNEIIKNHISAGVLDIKSPEANAQKQKQVYIEYMVTGFIGVIHFWLANSTVYSVEEISNHLVNIHIRNLLVFLEK